MALASYVIIVYPVEIPNDASAARAASAGATVIAHVENRGYGAAIKTGMAAARYDTIVITDMIFVFVVTR